MHFTKAEFVHLHVCAQPVLRPSGRARSTAVLFHGGRGELLASFSRLCANAVSGSISCSWFVLSSFGGGGCSKNISQSDSSSINFEGGDIVRH